MHKATDGGTTGSSLLRQSDGGSRVKDLRPGIAVPALSKDVTFDGSARMQRRRTPRGSDQSDVKNRHFIFLGVRVSPKLNHRLEREAQRRDICKADLVRALLSAAVPK